MNKDYDLAIVSGYFNPLHVGHLRMISGAARLAEKVFVIVNNDEQQILKKGRVIIPEGERLEIVQALRDVDDSMVACDSDPTVRESLKAVREKYPESRIVFANGGDRNEAVNIPEATTCEEAGIDLAFGVGGTDKADSSSRIIAGLGL